MIPVLTGLWTEEQDSVLNPSFDPEVKEYSITLPSGRFFVNVKVSKNSGTRWGDAEFVGPNKNCRCCRIDYFADNGSLMTTTNPITLERMQANTELGFKADFSSSKAYGSSRAVMTINVNNGFYVNSYKINIALTSQL